MLNDLLFYKVACLADSKAHNTYLEERDKKHQEGTLMQAQVASRPASSSIILLYAQNKKPATCPVQKMRTPPPVLPSSLPSLSFFFFFFVIFIFPQRDRSKRVNQCPQLLTMRTKKMRWLPIWESDSTRGSISVCSSLSLLAHLLQRRLIQHPVWTFHPSQHRQLGFEW